MHERFQIATADQGTSLLTAIARTAYTKEFPLLIHDPHDVVFLKVTDYLRNAHQQQAGSFRGQQRLFRSFINMDLPLGETFRMGDPFLHTTNRLNSW